MRVYVFLTKLKHELKEKIFIIEQVSETRQRILFIAILQKKILTRERENDENENHEKNSKKQKKQKSNEDFNNINRSQNQSQPNQSSKKNDSNEQFHAKTKNKRKRNEANHSHLTCFDCDEKSHIKSECSNKHK